MKINLINNNYGYFYMNYLEINSSFYYILKYNKFYNL